MEASARAPADPITQSEGKDSPLVPARHPPVELQRTADAGYMEHHTSGVKIKLWAFLL